jgi:hypothetical protein
VQTVDLDPKQLAAMQAHAEDQIANQSTYPGREALSQPMWLRMDDLPRSASAKPSAPQWPTAPPLPPKPAQQAPVVPQIAAAPRPDPRQRTPLVRDRGAR